MNLEEQKAAESQAALVKRLAERVAAEKRAEDLANAKKPVVIEGGPGAFCIYGPALGTAGTLTINGVYIKTTRWDDLSVRGVLPEGLRGEIVLTRADGVVRKGVYKVQASEAKAGESK